VISLRDKTAHMRLDLARKRRVGLIGCAAPEWSFWLV
jgi:hypothetical protein